MSYRMKAACFNRPHLSGFGVFIILALFSLNAMAADIGSAKRAGWLGEQSNGYLGLVNPAAPADVKRLMASVNQKRKSLYQKIARNNGVPLSNVEKMAGQKAIRKSASGMFVRLSSGNWKKK